MFFGVSQLRLPSGIKMVFYSPFSKLLVYIASVYVNTKQEIHKYFPFIIECQDFYMESICISFIQQLIVLLSENTFLFLKLFLT